MNKTLVQLISTKGDVLSILLSVLDSGQHRILILIGRIMEAARLNGT